MRWPILASLCVLASPGPALADDPLHTCKKAAPGAKLTIQFTPDLTLHDLGAWLTGFTCKSVVFDAEAAAHAPKLALIAPSAITPAQAVQLFVETARKAGLDVAEKPDAFVISLDASVPRPCAAPPAVPRPTFGAGACTRLDPGAKIAVSIAPDVTLDKLAAWVGGFTCKPVHFDPAVAPQGTKVNILVSTKVTGRQALRLFIDAVESTGLAVGSRDGGFEIKPGPRWARCASAAPAPLKVVK